MATNARKRFKLICEIYSEKSLNTFSFLPQTYTKLFASIGVGVVGVGVINFVHFTTSSPEVKPPQWTIIFRVQVVHFQPPKTLRQARGKRDVFLVFKTRLVNAAIRWCCGEVWWSSVGIWEVPFQRDHYKGGGKRKKG